MFICKLSSEVFNTLDEFGILRHTKRGPKKNLMNSKKPQVYVMDEHPFQHQISPFKESNKIREICLDNLRPIPRHKKSQLRFCALNIRSIRNKTSEFSDFVIENNL